MSEENEHYFDALDNDGDRESNYDDSETRYQMINRKMRSQTAKDETNESEVIK